MTQFHHFITVNESISYAHRTETDLFLSPSPSSTQAQWSTGQSDTKVNRLNKKLTDVIFVFLKEVILTSEFSENLRTISEIQTS